CAQGQVSHPRNCRYGKRAVEVREERTGARWLPSQCCAERSGVGPENDQPRLSGTMSSRALEQLLGRREVNEAVGLILRGAAVLAFREGAFPLVATAHVIDHAGHPARNVTPRATAR